MASIELRWLLAVPLLVVVLYWQHMTTAGFVYEEAKALAGASVNILTPRGLTNASWRLTQAPQAAHALSVVLHLGVIALMGLLAWRLGYSNAGVGLVTLFGAVHPLTVESVAYASARSELIAALGILTALVCAAGRWWKPWPVLGMAVGAVLGILGKESAVVVVALVPLTMWVRNRQDVPRGTIESAVGIGVIGLLILGGMAATGITPRVVNIGEAGDMRMTWLPWLLLQSAAAFRLIGLTFWPVGLTVDADIDLIPVALRDFALGALLALAGLSWALRRRPLVAYGLAWCLLCIVPRLIVQTPRGYLNDHQFLMPLIGLILASVAAWDGWRQDRLI